MARLTYQEASTRIKGCSYALNCPDEALPQARPDPSQAATIQCRATIKSVIRLVIDPSLITDAQGITHQEPGKVNLLFIYHPVIDRRCSFPDEDDPYPDEERCNIPIISQEAIDFGKRQGHKITMDKTQFQRDDFNLDPFKGPIRY